MRTDYSQQRYLSYAEAERMLDDAFGWGVEMRTTTPRAFRRRGERGRLRQRDRTVMLDNSRGNFSGQEGAGRISPT